MSHVPVSESFINYSIPFSPVYTQTRAANNLQNLAIGPDSLDLLLALQNSLQAATGGQGSHYSATMRFPSDNGGQLPPVTLAYPEDGIQPPRCGGHHDHCCCCHHEQTAAIQEDGGWPPIDPRQQQMQQLLQLLIMLLLCQMNRYPYFQGGFPQLGGGGDPAFGGSY